MAEGELARRVETRGDPRSRERDGQQDSYGHGSLGAIQLGAAVAVVASSAISDATKSLQGPDHERQNGRAWIRD